MIGKNLLSSLTNQGKSNEQWYWTTVKTPTKRPSHFEFLEEMSLNCEMSLN